MGPGGERPREPPPGWGPEGPPPRPAPAPEQGGASPSPLVGTGAARLPRRPVPVADTCHRSARDSARSRKVADMAEAMLHGHRMKNRRHRPGESPPPPDGTPQSPPSPRPDPPTVGG